MGKRVQLAQWSVIDTWPEPVKKASRPREDRNGVEGKLCKRCVPPTWKEVDHWAKCTRNKDGLQDWCKECVNSHQRRRYNDNISDARAYNRDKSARLRQNNSQRYKTYRRAHYEANRPRALELCRRWQQENAAKVREYAKASYGRNREAIAARTRAKRANNPDLFKARVRKWRIANPLKVRLHGLNRRARLANAEGFVTAKDILRISKEQDYACYYCQQALTLWNEHADHKQPLSRGGSNWPNNICLACAACNLSKNDKTEDEFWSILATWGLYPKVREAEMTPEVDGEPLAVLGPCRVD